MQQRSEETRARILDAAQKMFALHGYDATGVAEICDAAGVSKGAFYHHFPSKRSVFLELLQDWLEAFERRLAEVEQGGENVSQTLLRMTGMMSEVFQAASDRLPMFIEFWAQASRDPVFWQATIAPYHRFQQFFAGLVTRGIREETLRAEDPEIVSRVIVSLAVGVILQGLLDPQGADWEQVAARGMEYLVQGLAPDGQGG